MRVKFANCRPVNTLQERIGDVISIKAVITQKGEVKNAETKEGRDSKFSSHGKYRSICSGIQTGGSARKIQRRRVESTKSYKSAL
jgi:hypothetical protein